MPMGVPPSWIDIEGVRSRYSTTAKRPILSITGGHYGNSMGGSTVETWDRNFSVLGRQYRVLAVDKLGHGFTDNPRDNNYTIDALGRQLPASSRRSGWSGFISSASPRAACLS